MIEANKSMLDALVNYVKMGSPPRKLASFVDDGFVKHDGCLFLRAATRGFSGISWRDYHDRTGCECFVNHLHLGEFVRKPNIAHALSAAKLILARIEMMKGINDIRFIVVINVDDILIRFHRIRPGEVWLFEDLDAYEEAILTIDHHFDLGTINASNNVGSLI